MKTKIISIGIVILFFLVSFNAVGTDFEAEIENDCGCATDIFLMDNYNTGYCLGELPCEGPLPPGEVIDGPATLLASLDWRTKEGYDWTTPVKNQGNCGSCYAFGSYGAMEACLDIRDMEPNRNINLAEQYMVSCGPGWYPGQIMGCGGAYAEGTFAFITDHGAVDEECFPYTSGGGGVPPCNDGCPKIANVVGCGRIADTQSIKNALIKYGPVSASFAVYDDFYDYTSGIYEHTYGAYRGHHRIVIVGYNDNPGYWICKNSWGTNWGEQSPAPGGTRGWFRIAYGQCQIENEVYYIDVGTGEYNNEVTKYARNWHLKSSDRWEDYSDHGMQCNNYIWASSDWISYVFTIPKNEILGPVYIGVKFKANVIGANQGPDLGVLIPGTDPNNENNWFTYGLKSIGNPSSFVWKWYSVNSDFISSSNVIQFRMLAAWGCYAWLDEVGVRYYIPPPPPKPNLDASCSPNPLTWNGVKPGDTKTGTIDVKNVGETGSLLNWKVVSGYPNWITCSQTSGNDLPKGITHTVHLTIQSSSQGQDTRTGTIRLENIDDSTDFKEFTVSITTKKSLSRMFLLDLSNLLSMFPFLRARVFISN